MKKVLGFGLIIAVCLIGTFQLNNAMATEKTPEAVYAKVAERFQFRSCETIVGRHFDKNGKERKYQEFTGFLDFSDDGDQRVVYCTGPARYEGMTLVIEYNENGSQMFYGDQHKMSLQGIGDSEECDSYFGWFLNGIVRWDTFPMPDGWDYAFFDNPAENVNGWTVKLTPKAEDESGPKTCFASMTFTIREDYMVPWIEFVTKGGKKLVQTSDEFELIELAGGDKGWRWAETTVTDFGKDLSSTDFENREHTTVEIVTVPVDNMNACFNDADVVGKINSK